MKRYIFFSNLFLNLRELHNIVIVINIIIVYTIIGYTKLIIIVIIKKIINSVI